MYFSTLKSVLLKSSYSENNKDDFWFCNTFVIRFFGSQNYIFRPQCETIFEMTCCSDKTILKIFVLISNIAQNVNKHMKRETRKFSGTSFT